MKPAIIRLNTRIFLLPMSRMPAVTGRLFSASQKIRKCLMLKQQNAEIKTRTLADFHDRGFQANVCPALRGFDVCQSFREKTFIKPIKSILAMKTNSNSLSLVRRTLFVSAVFFLLH